MPNSFFRWEEEGARVHHCPVCHMPLSNKRTQLKCLGQHVEWCNRYHPQLFKLGCSSECKGCKRSDEQRHARYKQIAELVKEMHEVSDEQPFSIPKSATFPKYNRALFDGSAGKMSKRDRKDAKSRAKVAERAPAITTANVERVARILHPRKPVDEEFEKALLMDESIANNIFYHPGTANSCAMHERIINQDRSGKFELQLSAERMDYVISELLPGWEHLNSKKERDLIARLRKVVEEDFTHDHGEEQQTMMRKAGFWRWANREAYNRLAANGRIWDWKSGEALAPVVEQQADAADDGPKDEFRDTDAPEIEAPGENVPDGVETRGSGGGDDVATNVLLRGLSLASEGSRGGPASSSSVSRNTSTSSASRTIASSTDDSTDDFVTVGRKRLPRLDTGQTTPVFKFSSNGGLGHMSSRSTPRTPRSAFSMLTVEDADDSGDDDEYNNISPRTPCPWRK